MQQIICSKCKIEKHANEFNKCNFTSTGYQYKCRDCEKQYRTDNKTRIYERSIKYRQTYTEREKLSKQDYYKKNKERILARTKRWSQNNPDKVKNRRKKYYENNKERTKQTARSWRENNIDKYRDYQNKWTQNKRKTDPHYAIQHRLRNRTILALKEDKAVKTDSFKELCGCSIQELRIYIKSLFTDGMTWEKFIEGEIVIDHIKPCCAFNFIYPEHQKECFHYTNLRPIWKKDNEAKISQDLKHKLKK